MNSESDRPGPGSGRLLLYAILVVLILLVGIVVGSALWGRRPKPTATLQAMSVPTMTRELATATFPAMSVPTMTRELATATLPVSPSPAVPPPTEIPKAAATATRCVPSPPARWVAYIVKAGDTLYALASRSGLSSENVMQANCLTSSALQAGQRLYLPPMPTPTSTPCVPSPPVGWTLYTVRAGDTLFSLASTRGTNAQRVSQVNCMSSSSLLAGQRLYLPPLSIPFVSPAPATKEATSDILNARPITDDIPRIPILAGSPNDPNVIPCQTQKGHPWIHFRIALENIGGDDENPQDLEHGQRVYYFACEFPDPSTLTAWMTGPDNNMQQLDISAALPDPTVPMTLAQGVAVWSTTCDLRAGPYALKMQDSRGNWRQLAFNLKNTTRQRILTVPGAGSLQTTFQVYYCGYQDRANQEVEIDLCYGELSPDGKYEYTCDRRGVVRIAANGSARQRLVLPPDRQRVGYLLRDHENVLKGWDVIWLRP